MIGPPTSVSSCTAAPSPTRTSQRTSASSCAVNPPPCQAHFVPPLATCGSTRPMGLGIPLGMGCWNPACRRVAPVVLPRTNPRRSSSDRRGQERFKNCQKCRAAHYCSRDCQKADWRRHRDICASVAQSYTVDRRRETHEAQNVHTSVGFGTVYDFCLWAHLIGRLQNVLLRADE